MNSRFATKLRLASQVFAAASLLLSACTPAYNWREIRENEGGFAILLPAKPSTMSRQIELDGLRVTMKMVGARVDKTSFTVGAVTLPDASPTTREKATAAMRAGMVRNLQGRETEVADVQVPVVDAAGRPVAGERAARIEVEGRVAEQAAHMSATFVSRGRHAWQAVVIGPASEPDIAKLFHDSLRIVE